MKFAIRIMNTFAIFLFAIGVIYCVISVVAGGDTLAITPSVILIANAVFFWFIAIMLKAAPAMEYMRESRAATVDREPPPAAEKEELAVAPPPEGVHIPDASYWPAALAIGACVVLLGFAFDIRLNAFVTFGLAIGFAAGFGWAIEAWKERAQIVAHEKGDHEESRP